MSRTLFILSIAINLLLLTGIVYRHREAGGKPVAAVEPAARPAKQNQQLVEPVTEAPVASPLDWGKVYHQDYAKYAASLRAIGCPEETVQEIIYAAMEKEFSARARELNKTLHLGQFNRSMDYWRPYRANGEALQKRVITLLEWNLEKKRLLYSILAPDWEKRLAGKQGKEGGEVGSLAFLKPSQLSLTGEVVMSFRELETVTRMKYGRYEGKEIFEELAKQNQDREQRLLQIMSAEELKRLELRVSPIAERLRSRLTHLGATEQEFMAVYQVEENYKQQFDQFQRTTDAPAWRPKQLELAERKKSDLKAALSFSDRRDLILKSLE